MKETTSTPGEKPSLTGSGAGLARESALGPLPRRRRFVARLLLRVATVGRLFAHFANRRRLSLLPFVVVIVLAGVLLLLTAGISYVAPFVYTAF